MEATAQPSAPHEKVRIVFQICSLDFKSYPLRQDSSLGEKKSRLSKKNLFQSLSPLFLVKRKEKTLDMEILD